MISKIEVPFAPWSETENSWYISTKKGLVPGAWSNPFWFPKSVCNYDKKNGILEVPYWLLVSKGIQFNVEYL